jgi:hypothetical protein
VRLVVRLLVVAAAATGCSTVLDLHDVRYTASDAGTGGDAGAEGGAATDGAGHDDSGPATDPTCMAAPTTDTCAVSAQCELHRVASPVAASAAPTSLLLADGFVYFSAATGIWRAPIDGGSPAVAFADKQPDSDGLATDGVSLYWRHGLNIMSCARNAAVPCNPAVAYPFTGNNVDAFVAVAPEVLFVAQNTKLQRIDVRTKLAVDVVPDIAFAPYGIVADAEYV